MPSWSKDPGGSLFYIIQHIFLPPRLPQKDDYSFENDIALLECLLDSLDDFKKSIPQDSQGRWKACTTLVQSLLDAREASGALDAAKIQDSLLNMTTGDCIGIQVQGQNAAIIVRRMDIDYIFECFELSPTNESIMRTQGRLRRCFPGPAFAVNAKVITDLRFLEPFIEAIVKLDWSTPSEVWPIIKKADSPINEIRDTVDPRLVTEMLSGILRAVGRPYDANRVNKHTREEVLWNDALLPWRRSPLWMLLRVALQTTVNPNDHTEPSSGSYKSFMLFFMAKILQSGIDSSLPSELLYAMRAKISRRALKMGSVEESPWFTEVEMTIDRATNRLHNNWAAVEDDPDPQKTNLQWHPQGLDIAADTTLRLQSLRLHLAGIASRPVNSRIDQAFEPRCARRISLRSTDLPETNLWDTDDELGIRVHLVDLETWVERYLTEWLCANLDQQACCASLGQLTQSYIDKAFPLYAEEPEEFSLFILTVMELWIAMDKVSLHHNTLLCDFDHKLPRNTFEALLLPRRAQMKRLSGVEKYLADRSNMSKAQSPSIFGSMSLASCLAVRYFDQSSTHQQLKREIENMAAAERRRKLTEFDKAKERYTDLMRRASNLNCEYGTWQKKGRTGTYHRNDCERCHVQSTAKSMAIDLHEWPLPKHQSQAKAAVFELRIPSDIMYWRQILHILRYDLLSPPRKPLCGPNQNDKVYSLATYEGLKGFYSSIPGRLEPVSSAKPFVISHYRSLKVSDATASNICVNNGLSYELHDSEQSFWLNEHSASFDLRYRCTFKLGNSAFSNLQFALDDTRHTSNKMISLQSECPASMNLHEFYAFGTLRAGHRLQWRNIAREIVAGTLNFHLEEVQCLLLQAGWQAGPANGSSVCRESHIDLEEAEFGRSLLAILNEITETVEGNWQGACGLRTFGALAKRLSSLSKSVEIRGRCIEFLRRLQVIASGWMQDLESRLQQATEDEDRMSTRLLLVEVALTCHDMFDVDSQYFSDLWDSNDAIATAIQCEITIHDRLPTDKSDLSKPLQRLLKRYQSFMCRTEDFRKVIMLRRTDRLDQTITKIWPGCPSGLIWSPKVSPNERWLVADVPGDHHTKLHFNLLAGTLLVNGMPLARLPRSYEQHPTYLRLFRNHIFDVVPSTLTGMLFECREDFHGRRLHFRLCGRDLIVRCQEGGEMVELVPDYALKEDFPNFFSKYFTHWLNVGTNTVEFRPLSDPWITSDENWRLFLSCNGEWAMRRRSLRLIDRYSPTAETVSTMLSPLEAKIDINIILDESDGVLKVQLPRLKLDFFLVKGASHLQSKQFRHMCVDPNQSCGTLTGLVNKLVLLREIFGTERSIIVPDGDVSYHRNKAHVKVHIKTCGEHVDYFYFNVNAQLGRLTDDGTSKSKLVKCYLHAVTSHCLADKLTGHTGTEEALSILQCAAIGSFQCFSKSEMKILRLIADLTPRHEYYPAHLQVMQQTRWRDLPALLQHSSFFPSVQVIFEQLQSADIFDEGGSSDIPSLRPLNSCLHKRAAIRKSTYYVHGYGAEQHTSHLDTAYDIRGRSHNPEKENRVDALASLVRDWSPQVQHSPNLLRMLESWGSPIRGRTSNKVHLGYDEKWLEPVQGFLPDSWCDLQYFLGKCSPTRDKYRIMFYLSTLSYAQNADLKLIGTLLAFSTVRELCAFAPPQEDSFELSRGYRPDSSLLEGIVRDHVRAIDLCPESRLQRWQYETLEDVQQRQNDAYESAVETNVTDLVTALVAHWSSPIRLDQDYIDYNLYIATATVKEKARHLFDTWCRNSAFREHVRELQVVLDKLEVPALIFQSNIFEEPRYSCRSRSSCIDIDSLLNKAPPRLPILQIESFEAWTPARQHRQEDHSNLTKLSDVLRSSSSRGYEQQYVEDLRSSYNSLRENTEERICVLPSNAGQILEKYAIDCRASFEAAHNAIMESLNEEPLNGRRLAFRANMVPRLVTRTLIQCLAASNVSALPQAWKECIIQYALILIELQRSLRLLRHSSNAVDLLNEIVHRSHREREQYEYTEWLVFEIENDVSVRPIQAQIAREIISPSSRANAVMQLNMGEGKSSIIVPIAAAALAHGNRIVRVVVLKPLASQMRHLLIQKLGGLLDIRLYHMPVSRSMQLDSSKAQRIREMYEDCMRTGGILLMQPEHILSFEMMVAEQTMFGEATLARTLRETSRWVQTNSQDILDESDEILSVRFELVYTMGTQRAVDLSPERWQLVQQLLSLIHRHAENTLRNYPEGLKLQRNGPGSFPLLQILQKRAGNALFEAVTRDICDNGISALQTWALTTQSTEYLHRYLLRSNFTSDDPGWLERTFSRESVRKIVLLLKGFIGGGILAFCLQHKRWRVEYGLDLSRSSLAVPYHAKDVPSPRSEFSHPDVAIVLTCLSYFYQGLSDSQLKIAFEKLYTYDYAGEEYQSWIKDAGTIPDHFKQLSDVNLNDLAQCSKIVFPALRFAKSIINFYLSQIVFPKEMREFPQKLSSSGWDIARTKAHPTTGFSGTNDSRYILPLSVKQQDLALLRGTNALVIRLLLRPENSYQSLRGSDSDNTAALLIEEVVRSQPEVRIIIDVGAQVLEWTNQEVASNWLARVSPGSAQACIFFNDDNELSILDYDGRVEALASSPFQEQMDQCLVFLDEAHTRGTDLRLPKNYRALVTLGPRLVKDRLVQACMRMRKLGKGQSLVFCAPAEIERAILQETDKKISATIEVPDILKWCILNTCHQTRKLIPLWATQGLRYQRAQVTKAQLLELDTVAGEDCDERSAQLARALLEDEAQSIESRYGSGERTVDELMLFEGDAAESLKGHGDQIELIRQKCQQFGVHTLHAAALREEQERELFPENEREREVERPRVAQPLIPTLHKDVVRFVREGDIDLKSSAFLPAFSLLSQTGAKKHLNSVLEWPTDLVITTDFAKTVRIPRHELMDSFLQPVQWVLTSNDEGSKVVVVISPWEADQLLPDIRRGRYVTLHIYSPRVRVSQRPLDDLMFCPVPNTSNLSPVRHNIIFLNIFAGQLYFKNYDQYCSFCRNLGLHLRLSRSQTITAEKKSITAALDDSHKNDPNPEETVDFLGTITTLRRKGQSFGQSHMGKICQDRLITMGNFD